MKKIKHYLTENERGKKIVSISTILLFGSFSFLLGRVSKSNLDKEISIEYSADASKSVLNDSTGQYMDKIGDNTENTTSRRNGEYFASIKGKKYYPVGCSAGKNIKVENRIYFSTITEAENKGYEISSSCK